MIEQKIALNVVIMSGPAEVEMTLQPELGTSGGGLPAVVGLHARTPDHTISLLTNRLGEKELIVASLVASKQHARAIVALEEDPRSSETGGKTRNLIQRSG
jgi:hypothetical protein